MGLYVNRGNLDFADARRRIYIDKSEIISFVNETLSTPDKMTCVTRARRFGKSMVLKMLYAYYDYSCDSHELFDDLAIASYKTYRQYLNQYIAIHIDMTSFITGASSKGNIVDEMVARIIDDIQSTFPDVHYSQWNNLMDVLFAVVSQKKRRIVMLIDEWDAICRESSDDCVLWYQYINLLRNLFKGDNTDRVFAGVYMTGILPIKNYGIQSALNNFHMYSMTNPEPLEKYFGFTENEVYSL